MDEIWDRQRVFTERVMSRLDKPLDRMDQEGKVKWTKEYILALHAEADEALNVLHWKKHRIPGLSTVFDRGNLVIELIDMQKYLWGLMQVWGVTPEEFQQVFNDKSFEVERKWIQEQEVENISTIRNVCVVDIDGVLNYYPHCFYEWVNSEHGVDLEVNKDRVLREEMKRLYRASGAKRTQVPRMESVEFLRHLKSVGCSIVLLTDRPFMEVKRISFDTMMWLDNSVIPYDYLFWSHGLSKTHIVKKVGSVAFVVDDLLGTCIQFRDMGIRTFLFDSKGEHKKCEEGIEPIKSLWEIPRFIGTNRGGV